MNTECIMEMLFKRKIFLLLHFAKGICFFGITKKNDFIKYSQLILLALLLAFLLNANLLNIKKDN